MADPARRVFGAAYEAEPTSAYQPQTNGGQQSQFRGVVTDRGLDYQQWVQEVKDTMATYAASIYVQLGVSDEKRGEYLGLLDRMLDSILANKDDLFIKLMDRDFERAAGDMALNATRGDYTWPDIYRIMYPKPVVEDSSDTGATGDPTATSPSIDASTWTGTSQYGHALGAPDMSSWTSLEKFQYGISQSLLDFPAYHPDVPMSPSALEYYRIESGQLSISAQGTGEGAGTTSGAGTETNPGDTAADLSGQQFQAAVDGLGEAVGRYALSPDFIWFFNGFLSELYSGLGYPLYQLAGVTGTEATGATSAREEIEFVIDSYFEGEALRLATEYLQTAIKSGWL